MRAYLVDDEINARQVLLDKLKTFCPDIEIIGHTGDPLQALVEISQLRPDILFLDIEMPQLNGIDLAQKLPEYPKEIIFVTAYDAYAIEAFRLCAIGYILKPVNNDDLIKTVEHCQRSIKQKTSPKNSRLGEFLKMGKGEAFKVAIPTKAGYSFISLDEIIRLEADQNYTNIHSKDNVVLSSKNIGYFIDLLQEKGFAITHKSHLVNLKFVENFDRDGVIILSNGDHVPLGRRRKKDFLSRFIG